MTHSFPRLSSPPVLVAILVAVAVAVFAGVRYVATHQTQSLAQVQRVTTPAITPDKQTTAFNAAGVYAARVNGVVTITAVQHDGGTETGTGFVVDAQGHVLTAAHVLIGRSSANPLPKAVFAQFATYDKVEATVMGVDRVRDVAVLKVDPSQVALQPVPLGDSDKVVVGEPIAVIGSPFGKDESLSAGLVSGTRRLVKSELNPDSEIVDAIQTDAAVNRGNSGGPLFNARGEVVGIAQQIDTTGGDSSGVAFAIPIDTARRSMQQIISSGSVQYAYLGITAQTLTPQLAKAESLPVQRGAIVVASSGPAARAGISANGRGVIFLGDTIILGDVITSIGGAPVASKEDVTRWAARLDPGRPVQVEVWHNGTRRTVSVVPAEAAV